MNVALRSLAALTLGLAVAPAPARGLPVISEVLYDASGADNGGSFVELYGLPGTRVDGLLLEGVNGANGSVGPVVALSGTIPLDGFFVIADDAGSGTTGVAHADFIVDFDFQNGPDSIRLSDGTNTLDALGYGVFDPGEVFAGEGDPAPDAAAGSSLERFFANVDTGDNALDFGVLVVPTPGSAPLFVAPEPSVSALVLPGMTTLAWLGRRRRRGRRGGSPAADGSPSHRRREPRCTTGVRRGSWAPGIAKRCERPEDQA